MLICKAKFIDVEQVFAIQEETGLSYWSIEDYKNETSNPNAIFLVAKKDFEVRGFILVRLITSLQIAEIINIGIKKEHQNQGIGKLLLEKITSEIRILDIKKIELEVREQNTQAIKFYQKHFFTEQGIRKNFYQNPNDNAILMSRDV
jgi:ribosomal-protein-alanine N-acetyltransferase